MSVARKKIVVIGGMPRSGTGLVRRIIGSHSQVAILLKEFDFFRQLEAGKSVQEILTSEKIALCGLKLTHLYEQSPQKAYISTLIRFSEKSKKPIYGEKTPYNEFYYDILRNWLGGYDFKFIQLIRHPLESAASFKHAPFRKSRKIYENQSVLENFADNWRRSAALGLARSYQNPKNYLLLRYEPLLADPINTVRQVCKFLSLDFEKERMLLNPDFAGRKDNTSFSEDDLRNRRITGVIYQPQSRQHVLSKVEKEVVGACCGELANALGYEAPEFKSLPPNEYDVGMRKRIHQMLTRDK